jgi:ribosomal protein S27E
MKTYSVKQVKQAGCTLEPIKCRYCGSLEVVYNQYIGDGSCQECGEWQGNSGLTAQFV